jgi:hypothetical protein
VDFALTPLVKNLDQMTIASMRDNLTNRSDSSRLSSGSENDFHWLADQPGSYSIRGHKRVYRDQPRVL